MAVTSNMVNVNILSYNMHDLNQGSSLLFDLCNNKTAKIMFIQEHWMTPVNMPKIFNFHKDYSGFGVSGMEKAVSNSILRGRPFGGVAILVHNDYLKYVSCLHG